ncbi:MAG: methyltransferase domain-containing protein [Planctomycetes bacterium]|nr:methyltransferase domain-containing protein [Planctomycetota bacterium]
MYEDHFEANRRLWDTKAPIHHQSSFYDLDGFRRTKDSLNAIERDGLGDVRGKSLLHLQCHFGQDTLSWAHRGAEVTGVDFSGEGIRLARQLSAELDIPATFVEANVLELDRQLEGSFDIVFTSYGTTCWLPDLARWAEVIDHFLAPGGTFYIADFHPMLQMFDHGSQTLAYEYFGRAEPNFEQTQGSYAAPEADIRLAEYFWQHSLSEILTPLLARGLELLEFKEFPSSPYDAFPNTRRLADGSYRFGDQTVDIPHVFSLKMRKRASK